MRPWLLPSVVLWAWQMDLGWAGFMIGLLFEAPRLSAFRLTIAQADFERLWNFTAVLFLGVVFYLLLADRGLGVASNLFSPETGGDEAQREGILRISATALTFLHLLPLILLPFTMAHAWSTSGSLPWSTFSLYEQARARREPLVPPPAWAVQPMHPGLAYQGVVLFSAITLPDPGPWFLPVWIATLLLALWPWRNPHGSPFRWFLQALLLGLVAWAAHFSHGVSRQTWDLLETQLQRGLGDGEGVGIRHGTALGAVGRLQQSSQILLRGDYPPGRPPGLLAEAVFDRFTGISWEVSSRTWASHPVIVAPHDPQRLTIIRGSDAGRIAVVAPLDSRAIALPALATVEAHPTGTLRLLGGPSLVIYQVVEGGEPPSSPTPEDLDLSTVPLGDVEAAQAVLATLQPPLVPAVQNWLAEHCRYTLDLAQPPDSMTPVEDFLARRRAGHCEFFAASTVLILRAGGIPARYVVGFSPESQDGQWVARGRHAHAWALAWVDQQWQVVDSTPPDWQGQQTASWWEPVQDAWSWVVYRFQRWRAEGGDWRLVVLVVGIAVLAWIGWRQVRGSRWLRHQGRASTNWTKPGQDSALWDLIRDLERRNGTRAPATSLRAWLAETGCGSPEVQEAVDLHDQWRFSAEGLSPELQDRLRHLVAEIRAQIALRKGAPGD